MRLQTLGGMALEGSAFSRPKPLLLLTYLAVEGRQPRRHVAELFWPGARDRMKALTVALARLRQGAPDAIGADATHAWSSVDLDAERFLAAAREARHGDAVTLYTGPFLADFDPRHHGGEVEEWVYQTREYLAGHARRALLAVAESHAERGQLAAAATHAERAYGLPGAAPPERDDMQRIHALLHASRSPTARRVAEEARALGIDPGTASDTARAPGPSADRPRPASRVPQRVGAFVGRARERASITALLVQRDGRLVTLVGPPGVGKSRLAERVALDRAEHGDLAGVTLVQAGALRSASELPAALAAALELTPRRAASPLDTVCEALGETPTLLVLDDVEALAADDERRLASVLETLLQRCPGLRLLTTSRRRLALEHERCVPLEGLAYPRDDRADLAEVRGADAVRLFEQRAGRVRPGFAVGEDDVAGMLTICRIVDGSPLALELAASWVRAMSVADIAAELDRGLDLLVADHRDAGARHASMRSALDASWRLLDARERGVLGALSVLVDGFDRAAAQAVAEAGPRDLATLIDASLLRSDGAGGYALHPLVRQYAVDRLTEHPTSLRLARSRQVEHYVALLCAAETDLDGSERQAAAIARVAGALPNVLAAWRCAAEDGAIDALWQACRPLQRFFSQRGGMDEGAALAFAHAHAHLASDDPSQRALVGRLLAAEAWFRYRAGAVPLARAATTRALDLLRGAESDAVEDADTASDRQRACARAEVSALNTLANVAQRGGDLRAAERHLAAGLERARASDEAAQRTMLLNNLALLTKARGAHAEAEELLLEALSLNRARSDLRSAARNLVNLGSLLVVAGRPQDAVAHLEEGVRLATVLGYDALMPDLLACLGGAMYTLGDLDQALERYRASLERSEAYGDATAVAHAHAWLARVEATRGDERAAHRHLAAALPLAHAVGDAWLVSNCLLGLAERSLAADDLSGAALLVGAAEALDAIAPDDAERLDAAKRRVADALAPATLRSALRRGASRSIERIALDADNATRRPPLRAEAAPGATRS